MTVVQRVLGLAQGAKQVARNEDNAKKQHALIKPTSHSSGERSCPQSGRLCFEIV